ncbi:hypothetical protein VTL71DRAFT_13318 [Oculimacula yallundae]|uniref:Uncharacterized protein n=1 Tax=Oculimacula yallundae TaxID=86028 RepID=A0ABR4CLA0_9HELO
MLAKDISTVSGELLHVQPLAQPTRYKIGESLGTNYAGVHDELTTTVTLKECVTAVRQSTVKCMAIPAPIAFMFVVGTALAFTNKKSNYKSE